VRDAFSIRSTATAFSCSVAFSALFMQVFTVPQS